MATLPPNAELLAPRDRLNYFDAQSRALPQDMTALQAWNALMARPLPLMGLAFKIRDKISSLFGVKQIGGFTGDRKDTVQTGDHLDFFLVDDAFRMGEYIQAGDAKGTVEKISVRSIQLRHHNGPVYTVPFGEIRHDYFDINPEDAPETDFSRTLGQVGLDVRWPFINAGKNVNIIVEPRALITQSFGDGKIANFTAVDSNNQTVSLSQDSIDIDLDQALFWSANKSTGYDFWQKGFRADVGGAVSALWGNSRTSLFLGQSFASNYNDNYGLTTGLSGDTSDLVGLFELDLNGNFVLTSRVRYDDDTNKFRRIDTGFSYYGKRLSTSWRYYKIDAATLSLASDPTIPAEEISGGFTLKLTNKWSARYAAYHDIGRDITRRQELALIFGDCCTRIEFVYDESNFDSDVIRDSQGFGIRLSLATLGDFGEE